MRTPQVDTFFELFHRSALLTPTTDIVIEIFEISLRNRSGNLQLNLLLNLNLLPDIRNEHLFAFVAIKNHDRWRWEDRSYQPPPRSLFLMDAKSQFLFLFYEISNIPKVVKKIFNTFCIVQLGLGLQRQQ